MTIKVSKKSLEIANNLISCKFFDELANKYP